jgi:hypothetical protein
MRFISKRREFRLIIRPTEVILDESRRPRVMYGEKVEFKNGVFNTTDKSLIDYLLHHDLYGTQFTSEIGSDPVQIEKYSLVFDDGAELSGPKVVAGFPERNKKTIEMVTGARSTIEHPVQVEPVSVPPVKQIEKSDAMTKEEINALMDSKLDSFLDRIGTLIIAPKISGSPKKPKEFHCPICQKQFASGIAVGKHKKEEHPN